jgi:hypothetical protein
VDPRADETLLVVLLPPAKETGYSDLLISSPRHILLPDAYTTRQEKNRGLIQDSSGDDDDSRYSAKVRRPVHNPRRVEPQSRSNPGYDLIRY